jgi:cytochrome bd-type quinol oxidase subunit 2
MKLIAYFTPILVGIIIFLILRKKKIDKKIYWTFAIGWICCGLCFVILNTLEQIFTEDFAFMQVSNFHSLLAIMPSIALTIFLILILNQKN